MSKKILIISGEPSGDLHAANLIRDLKISDPSLKFFGIGGGLSRKAGADVIFDITKLALVGAVEVIKNISVVKRAHDTVMSRIKAESPDAAILVDYPGFNLRMARDLAKRGIPVFYYISPQLWAWAPKRIDLVKKYVKKMVVFFKFEEDLYKRHGIDAEFVGHPLLDVVKVTSSRSEVLKKYGLSETRPTIAILPGSRISEINTFLPILAESARVINEKMGGVQFILSKHPARPASMYEGALKGAAFEYRIAEGDLHNIVAASDFAIVASGTATLETAIVGTPYLLVYKASLITYMLYKIVATIPFLGIANVVAGRGVIPEFLQFNMTPAKISAKTIELISDPAKLAAMRRDLAEVKSALGSPGASARAAGAILPLL
jgi:lipid-A-disaccharide synthase